MVAYGKCKCGLRPDNFMQKCVSRISQVAPPFLAIACLVGVVGDIIR